MTEVSLAQDDSLDNVMVVATVAVDTSSIGGVISVDMSPTSDVSSFDTHGVIVSAVVSSDGDVCPALGFDVSLHGDIFMDATV